MLAAIAILIGGWWTLPVQLDRASSGPSGDECLRLADHPPAGDALSALERCTVLVPDDVQLLADLGEAYEVGGRAGDAEATYRRALERDPDYADLHARLARLLLRRNAAAEARAHLDAALALQPNRRALIELRGEISRAAGPGP